MTKERSQSWRGQVAAEHQQLHQTVAELRQTLQQPRPRQGEPGSHTWAADLSRQLVDFHALLSRHFRFEEKGGMMEDLMERHPRATGQVNEMIDEHAALLAENRKLIGLLLSYAEGDPAADLELRSRLAAMLDLLGEHERKENALVMDLAFNDLGAGD